MSDAIPWWTALVPAAAFAVLVVFDVRSENRRRTAERAVALHELELARLDGDWPGRGPDGARFAAPEHPYVDHLDVFGRGSLFQLLTRARTPQGERRLAEWLSAAAPEDEIRSRQSAVQELAPLRELRERVALLGDTAATARGVEGLAAWGTSPPALPTGALRSVHHALAFPPLIALVLWLAGVVPIWWTAAALAVCMLVLRRPQAAARQIAEQVEGAHSDLRLLAGLLRELHGLADVGPGLAALTQRVAQPAPAHEAIESLGRLVGAYDQIRNQFFTPIAILTHWPVQIAHLLEAWRAEHGPHIAGWIDALADFEALLSLAGQSDHHPGDVFPVLRTDGPASIDFEGAAHPLLPTRSAVSNDVAIGQGRRVHIVSGSNMAGKSTYLRTTGVNTVLALAGGPVRASAATLTPVAVAASIRTNDSLLDGESRFYAEVARIGRVVGLARTGRRPVLFLLDELFHGTNSADRRTGAAAVVRTLVEQDAVGLVTTHDLELARIAQDVGEGIVNVHFEEQFEDGRMSFDYRLRPGVVTRSNALAIMRAVGLDVGPEAGASGSARL